jgi:signal transduction histidine kinase
MVAAPIVFNDALVGAIAIKSTTPGIYGEHQAELLERIAELLAGAIANVQLHAAVTTLAREEQIIAKIGRSVTASLDFSNAYDLLSQSVNQLVPYDRFVVMGLDSELTTMSTLFVAGDEMSGWEVGSSHPLADWQDIIREMTHEGALLNLDPKTVSSDDRALWSALPGCAIVPLVWDDKPVGVISVRSKIPGRFTRHHLELLGRVARQITGAFVNADLAANLERRVQERTESLQRANSELEAFSYTVSHDLRGPLTMNAHLAARLLESEQDTLSETSKKYIELIARSSTESSELVTDLLNFARLGHQDLNVQRVDPASIVSSLEAEFSELYPEIHWQLDLLPDCDADPGLLRAVFTNLLSNACKFTVSNPEPSIVVGATEENGETVYHVRDNGVGFDMDQSHKVFEVFERLHRPEDYSGTGAGLAIVRRIVERHGGRVWVESEVGLGTTFFFTLSRTT